MSWLKEVVVSDPPLTSHLPICRLTLGASSAKSLMKGSHVSWKVTFTLNVDGVEHKKDVVLDVEVV